MPATAPLRVEDLLHSPALELRVLAGEAGLSRPVSWAHVSELEDPTPWLLGAEMIMTTGIAVPRSAARQRAYVERLDDAGVAALALSIELHVPPLRPAFFAAAQERGMPVLEVPLHVPFIAVAQEVAAAAQSDARQWLGAQIKVFDALRWLASEDLETVEVFRRLERLSGYALFLCTPQGRTLLPGVPVPQPWHAALLPSTPDPPPTIPGGFVLPVPAPGGPAGYLLALTRKGAQPAGLAVAQHIAAVAALHVTMARHERETLRREGAETLAELLQDGLDPATVRRRLTRAGFRPRSLLVLVVLRGTDGPPEDGPVVRALEEAGTPHLLLHRQQELYALIADFDDVLGRALTSLPGTLAGASRPFPAGSPFQVASREAAWALARAADSLQPLVIYGTDMTDRWLHEDPAALRGLSDDVLGPALRYDTDHGTALVSSVLTWMERDRRTDEAARALLIHPNTLAYRLKRFTALTGKNLASTADLTEVWLAVRAARALGELT